MGREHWVETTLGACCQINPRNKVNDESLEVTFVTMSDISQNSPLFKSTQLRSFSEVKKGFTHFAENDVLFAKITPCMENGKAALANNLQNGLGCGTTELHVIRPLCGVESAFVYNFVHQPIFRTEAEQRFTGSAGQRRVPVEFLYEYPFPLPPLNEQKRIVEKLDAILPKVKNAKARLEKIPLILKKFRQSVLSAACSGRLTEDWREKNTEVAAVDLSKLNKKREELQRQHSSKKGRKNFNYKMPFEISLGDKTKGIDELFELPDTWTWVTLDQVVWSISDGPHFSPQYVDKNDGVAFISSSSLSDKQ